MTEALRARRDMEPEFAFARDGVHPGREGHWLIARQILALLGDTAAAGAPRSEALLSDRHAEEVRGWVRERMVLLRDALLTEVGHARPGLAPGVPLEDARARAAAIGERIRVRLGHPAAGAAMDGTSDGSPGR